MTAPDLMAGAFWCERHGRRECTRNSSRSHARCHNIAIAGRDACRNHVGESLEVAKEKGQVALMLSAALAETPRSHPGEILLKAGHAAHVLLDRMLASTPETGAAISQLEQLVSAIDRAARIAKAALDADAQDRWVRAQESVASRDWEDVKTFVSGVLVRLGRSWDEPEVVAAVRAELEAGETT